MSVTPPALPDYCWPVDWSCAAEFENDPGNAEVVALAESLAIQTLRMLTAYKVGGCPITLRPCAPHCAPRTTLLAPTGARGAHWVPYIMDGVWFNACGHHDCACSVAEAVTLPGPIGKVTEVNLSGTILPSSSYRVDNSTQLVRTDGFAWPIDQDMSAPVGAPNTFAVTMQEGATVDALGAAAAGALAYEYAKGLCGSSCALPPGVVQMTSGGTTMLLEAGSFPGGLTGILVVDSYVRFWNPYLVKTAPDVWSPDLPRARRTTWEA